MTANVEQNTSPPPFAVWEYRKKYLTVIAYGAKFRDNRGLSSIPGVKSLAPEYNYEQRKGALLAKGLKTTRAK